MKLIQGIAIVATAFSLSACGDFMGEGGGGRVDTDKTKDYGFKSHDLSTMTAGVWVDPNGCDHWIIDDGVEGYLSQRLDKYGKPVCSGAAPPNTAVGPYHNGETVNDPL